LVPNTIGVVGKPPFQAQKGRLIEIQSVLCYLMIGRVNIIVDFLALLIGTEINRHVKLAAAYR
jgi:hypothetical protein